MRICMYTYMQNLSIFIFPILIYDFFFFLDNLGYLQEAGPSKITLENTKQDADTNGRRNVVVNDDDGGFTDFSTPDLNLQDLFPLRSSTPKHQPSSSPSKVCHRDNGEYSNNFKYTYVPVYSFL